MEIIENTHHIDISPCAATIGCFDGVHGGHKYLVRQVNSYAQQHHIKSALITFTTHPRQVMQSNYLPRLLSCPKQKVELISHLDTDYCFMMPFTIELSKLSAFEFMKFLKQTYNVCALFIGYDHRFGHNRAEGFEDYRHYGEMLGIEVVQAKELKKDERSISSSLIRNLLQQGEIEKANEYLEYNYYIDGTIVDGFKMGRKLGFPTANLQPSCSGKLVPQEGVYAIYAYIKDKKYGGMLNIGHRPTLHNGNHQSIEANIFNFSDNIYNETIRIEFVKKIRAEQEFDSIDQLCLQLQHDKKEIINIIGSSL